MHGIKVGMIPCSLFQFKPLIEFSIYLCIIVLIEQSGFSEERAFKQKLTNLVIYSQFIDVVSLNSTYY